MKWKIRFGAALGNMLEHYDIAVFAAVSVYLSAELKRLGYHQATEIVWGIFALRYMIRPLGGYIIGCYADRVGKKPALILTTVITGGATFCMALIPIETLGVYTPIVIFILQVALSFSFAGEYPSLITYLFSGADSNESSKVSTLSAGSSLLGFFIAFGLVFVLEKIMEPELMQSIGWRIPLLLGIVNVLVSFWFRAKLPDQPIIKTDQTVVKWRNCFYVFLIAIPSSATFYTQSISSSLVSQYFKNPELKSIYGMLSTGLLLVAMVICSWLTDKYSKPERVFNMGVMGLVIFSIPIYYAMNNGGFETILVSQFFMTIYISMIWCNVADQLVRASGGEVTILGVGFNLTATLVGGMTPLIISYLVDINLIYVGMFLSLCGLFPLTLKMLKQN